MNDITKIFDKFEKKYPDCMELFDESELIYIKAIKQVETSENVYKELLKINLMLMRQMLFDRDIHKFARHALSQHLAYAEKVIGKDY